MSLTNTTQIWRINLKPAAQKGADPVAFCLEKGIIGFGWSVHPEEPMELSSYLQIARKKFGNKGWVTATNNMRRMRIGDLCWTRNKKGIYYLGRITGDWCYASGSEYEQNNVVNIRSCEWIKAGTDSVVPGVVKANFRVPNTLSSVRDDARIYSEFLFNSAFNGDPHYVPTGKIDSFFDLLDDADCEDLIGIYMQHLGYVLIPSSCKKGTIGVEWEAHHKETGQKAVSQVKTGHSTLNPFGYEDYTCDGIKVFLFSPKQTMPTKIPEHIIWVRAQAILEQLSEPGFQRVLPTRIRNWLAIFQKFNQAFT
jgi:hypothetical protein